MIQQCILHTLVLCLLHPVHKQVTTGLSPTIKRRLICYLCPGPDPHIFLPWQWIQYHCRSSLGLDFTSNLSWDKYIRSIVKRALQRVGCLYRAQQYLPQLLCSTCISSQYVLSWNIAAIFGLVLQLVNCPCLTVYSDVLPIELDMTWHHLWNPYPSVAL